MPKIKLLLVEIHLGHRNQKNKIFVAIFGWDRGGTNPTEISLFPYCTWYGLKPNLNTFNWNLHNDLIWLLGVGQSLN